MENNLFYKKYENVIESVFSTFYYVEFSMQEKEKIILDIKNEYNDTLSSSAFKEKLTKKIYRIISVQLKNDPISIIDKYLNYMPQSYQDALNVLENIFNLFKNTLFSYDQDLLINLVKTNKSIYEALTIIFNQHEQTIVSGNIDKIFKNELYIELLETYVLIENIDVQIPEDETDEKIHDSVTDYFKEISKIPLLSYEKEKELLKRIKEGDQEARKLFIESNLRLVVSIAKRYHSETYTLLDLIEDGNLGLIKVLDKYDLSLGYKFSTYATYWIRQEICRGLTNKSRIIRLPVHMEEQIEKCKQAMRKYADEHGKNPDIDTLSELTGISPERIAFIQKRGATITSLNENISDDSDEKEMGEFIPSEEEPIEDQIIDKELRKSIHALLDRSYLTENEKKVLLYRFGFIDGHVYTLEAIGKIIHLTRERVRQIEKKALNKIRSAKEIRGYINYSRNPQETQMLLEQSKISVPKTKIVETHRLEILKLFPNMTNNELQRVVNYLTAKEILILVSDSEERQEVFNKVCEFLYKKIKQKPIYNNFVGFSLKEVDAAVSKLSSDEIALTRKEYVTYGEKDTIIKVIIPKLVKILIGKNSIYEFFKDYDKEIVDKCIDILSYWDKNVIENFKSHSLNEREENHLCFHIIPRLSKEVKNFKTLDSKKLEDYFPGYSASFVWQVIDLFPNEEKDLLYKRFKENYKLDTKENTQLNYSIIPKIKRRIQKIYEATNIYELLYKYKKDDVTEALKVLNDEEMHIVDTFNQTGKVSINDFNILNFVIVSKMESAIIESKKPKYHNIYEAFAFYEKRDVDFQLENLDASDRFILNKYFSDYKSMTVKDKDKFNRIVLKVEKRLHVKQIYDSMYEFFSDYSKEQVDAALKKLLLDERKVIMKKFDKQVTLSKEEINLFYNEILPKVRSFCQIPKEKPKLKYKTIYDFFLGYDKEKIDLIISCLSYNDQMLMRKKFNEGKLTLSEKNRFYGSIILIIKKAYASLDQNNIHNVFKTIPNEIIDKFIDTLSEDEKRIVKIKSVLGRLSNVNDSREYVKILEKLKIECLNEINDLLKISKRQKNEEFLYTFNENFTLQDYNEILELLKNENFQELEENFSLQESFVIAMKFGFLDGRCFCTKVVSEFYGISEKEVNQIIYQYLIKIKEGKVNYVRTITRSNN